jgi:diguanylate cyclase (GGDEF)-like protein
LGAKLQLTRNYSIRSLLGIVIIAVALVLFYRTITIQNLITQETKFNVSLARSMAVTMLPHHAEFMRDAAHISPAELADSTRLQAMMREVVDKMRGLRVIKIKLYDTRGYTLFSTDTRQIGEDKSGNQGFLTAMAGQPASELTFRDSFSSFEQVIENVDVLSSYIPIRRDEDGQVDGVFEIYSDVSSLVNDIERTGYTILAGVTVLLLILYGFLLAVVRRADRVLERYEEEQRQRHQARLDYLTHYDGLTELPNRSRFMAVLSESIAHARSGQTGLGIIYLSLDRFKLINDGLGHEIGDRILVEFARRLRACVDGDGVVARMGGDHFAILSTSFATARAARLHAENIILRSNQIMRVGGRDIVLTVSLGIAALQDDSDDADLLLEQAISAMRKAKESGRNGLVFYTRQIDSKPQERLQLEMDLRRALERREFILHYQPRVDVASRVVTGMEALLRWQHPERGLVAPMDFVPLLEDMELMIPVGAWVMEEACRQASAWHASGYPHLRVSVNLSLRQFRAASLVDAVCHALQESSLDGRYLELELTESVLADNVDKARHVLQKLKALGVGVAIDDFGTGYSSLSYLINFPVTCLKVDRVFITDVAANKAHAALTTAIVAMAESLGLDTVAEGVETSEQLEFISALGCSEVQGFWFSPPVSAHEFPAAIAAIEQRSAPRRISDAS